MENVSKLKVVESNDTGKTDEKDPRVILMLWKLGKTLTDRVIRGEYLLLRENNRIYDVEEKEQVRVRNRIHECLMELFCDYSFKKDFLYGKSGRALIELYGCSPYRIDRSGWIRFRRRMKREVPGIREDTLRRLWDDASTSVLHRMDGDYVAVLQVRIRQLWEEYLLRESRLEGLREEIVRLVGCLRKRDSRIPQATRGVITEFWIGRLLGETGPLGDFSDIRKLYRYAGLNIRERRSGTYVGQNRISKKGRSSLRKVLGQIVFPLVKRGNLYGEYYHGKREHGMSGTKALTAVQRKFLKMFYGWYKSESAFDIERVFNSRTVSICAV